ncbi:MAG: hypothetical protein V4850_26135 [Myxococcota bacterium]
MRSPWYGWRPPSALLPRSALCTLRAAALAFLAGCSGTATIEGLDPFGVVWSASWFRFDDGGFAYDQLQLTNEPDSCERVTAFYAARASAVRATAALPEEGWCASARAPYQAWAAAGDAVLHDGAHFIDLSLFHGSETAPIEATFGVDDSTHLLSGLVTYVQSNPYRTFLEDWDEEGTPGSCGIDEASLTGLAVVASLSQGTLDLRNVEDEAFAAGRLHGDLEDIASDATATIDATFRASWCEVDVSF